jgi:hypothetical protein
MSAEHTGRGHGDVTLSLTTETRDGGRVHQSWTICECSARVMRGRLGPPQHEAVATAEATRAIAETVLRQPGSVQA